MSLIDFKKLAVMIPEKGAITVSVQNSRMVSSVSLLLRDLRKKICRSMRKAEDSVDVAKAISPIVFDDSIENLEQSV